MKKIAIFGGTFNPVHNGHLNLINSIQEKMQFDEILLIPSYLPPHKEVKELASGKDRMKMLSLATEGILNIGICDIELNKKGKSYTIETVKMLKQLFSNSELYLVVGADMLLTFDTWKNWREILKYVFLVASSRNEGEEESLLKKAYELNKERIIVVKTEPFSVSSTEIRNKLKLNEDVSHLLPEKVLHYINQKRLYK